MGINPAAAQDIDLVDEGAADTGSGQDAASPNSPDKQQESNRDKDDRAEESGGGSAGAANRDDALSNIDVALRNLERARDGSFEEYGRALDELDKAVGDYQKFGDGQR